MTHSHAYASVGDSCLVIMRELQHLVEWRYRARLDLLQIAVICEPLMPGFLREV
jgi:hypothetical protein